MQVLVLFSTESLLKLVPVCHRFQNLVLRIVHRRLLLAASLKDRRLILECYHPSAQYTEPYLFCDYLGTPGLSDEIEGHGRVYDAAEISGGLGRLRELYSRFRPTRPYADPPFRSQPNGNSKCETKGDSKGDVPGSQTSPSEPSSKSPKPIELAAQTINLDSHELFSQLCVSVNLVQVGPRRGVFLSCVDILRKTIPRIWREWLAESAENPGSPDLETTDLKDERKCRRIIWVDHAHNVGIRARVQERRWRRNAPILIHKDEDQAVSYSIELEGKFLYISLCGLGRSGNSWGFTRYHCPPSGLGYTTEKRANDNRVVNSYYSCPLSGRKIAP